MRRCAGVTSVGSACILALWLLAVPAGAWSFTASASTTCASTQAEIAVTFKNTEAKKAKNGITVTATDNQTGHSITLGPVKAGQSVVGTIVTAKTSLKAGTVTIHMTWTGGQEGHDDRSRDHEASDKSRHHEASDGSPNDRPSDRSLTYQAIDCAEPPPMLAEGLNGFTVGGAVLVVGAGVLYWRRRRGAHPSAASLSSAASGPRGRRPPRR